MAQGRHITALNNHFQGSTPPSWRESVGGPAHAVVWTMECKVGDQVLGIGSAGQKQTAKERAAEIACQALGIPA